MVLATTCRKALTIVALETSKGALDVKLIAVHVVAGILFVGVERQSARVDFEAGSRRGREHRRVVDPPNRERLVESEERHA